MPVAAEGSEGRGIGGGAVSAERVDARAACIANHP
eukprot:CAMPEP_0171749774 /NCGR_PEP_ID=MMETSP0991-20121206/40958_1 /TAXON_ID=483369 /ORGANISM="non described non described, Strain CCMP2098" /LENGTH=34 /DNA_ID= /DNA_START= /DNA_END= /DNA_ORIENTATION=